MSCSRQSNHYQSRDGWHFAKFWATSGGLKPCHPNRQYSSGNMMKVPERALYVLTEIFSRLLTYRPESTRQLCSKPYSVSSPIREHRYSESAGRFSFSWGVGNLVLSAILHAESSGQIS